MLELVDMPGRSILGSISRLWTCHLKWVRGGFRYPFRDPKLGVLNFCLVTVFVLIRGDPLKKKTELEPLLGVSVDDGNPAEEVSVGVLELFAGPPPKRHLSVGVAGAV